MWNTGTAGIHPDLLTELVLVKTALLFLCWANLAGMRQSQSPSLPKHFPFPFLSSACSQYTGLCPPLLLQWPCLCPQAVCPPLSPAEQHNGIHVSQIADRLWQTELPLSGSCWQSFLCAHTAWRAVDQGSWIQGCFPRHCCCCQPGREMRMNLHQICTRVLLCWSMIQGGLWALTDAVSNYLLATNFP